MRLTGETSGHLTLTHRHYDTVGATIQVPVTTEGQPPEIAFDPKHLADATLVVCHHFVTSRVHDAGNGVNFDQIRLRNPFGVRRLERSTPAWIRTKDQLIKSQLLYQLSYRGVALCHRHSFAPKGSFALTTTEV